MQHNGLWRMAVRALRVGYVGLALATGALIALALGSTPWILASGVFIWLATVPLTLTGFYRPDTSSPASSDGRASRQVRNPLFPIQKGPHSGPF